MLRRFALVVALLAGAVVHATPTADDRDGDGIPNGVDQCPDAPEDKDGFEDKDGCPDPDNDQDRILDVDDQCPNQAESYNGYQDADGCPDRPSAHVIICPNRILDRIYFKPNASKIKPVSRPILDNVVKTLKAYAMITSVTVVGQSSADERKDVSRARADAVMAYLVAHGVAAARVHAAGKGTDYDPGAPVRGPLDHAVQHVVHFDIVLADPSKK